MLPATNTSKGKVPALTVGQQRAAAQMSGYRPRFHKTMAFAASIEETSDPALSELGPSLPEDEDHLGGGVNPGRG